MTARLMEARLSLTAAVATLAASIALSPLISGAHWFWAGAGAVCVASAAGMVVRLRPLPVIACFLTAMAAEFVYLNAAFAGSQSRWLVIPTGLSLHHLGSLVSDAASAISAYAPPAPGSPGIDLVAAAGIGFISVTVDLAAVRLRRPALAGLPLLVLFCVPLTTSASPHGFGGVLEFCLAVTGFLALLSAEGKQRLRVWGKVVMSRRGNPDEREPDVKPLGATGRRLGFTAVLVAVSAPLLVPGLRPHQLFGHSDPGHGHAAALTLPEPLVQLNKQLHAPTPQTVLTYHTTDPMPPYLQVYVLSQLNADSWRLAVPRKTVPLTESTLPAVPGLSGNVHVNTVREQIRLGSTLTSAPTTLSYLPLPYAPRSVHVAGEWRVDRASLGVLTAGTELADLRYSVTSADVEPSGRKLRLVPSTPGAAADGYLGYPDVFSKLRPLASRITAGQVTDYDKAVALQAWFTKPGNFTYSLNVAEPHSSSALIKFLTKDRRGYCQQFAFGMAVLARLLDIPSRVVVGYTQGTLAGPGTWRVTTGDAHAWPELYFQGAGWLRFEPTPSGTPGQATAFAPAYSLGAPRGDSPTSRPTATETAPGGAGASGAATNKGALSKLEHLSSDQGGAAAHPGKSPFPVILVLLVVLGVALAAPPAARSAARQIRWLRATGDAGHAHAAWREVLADLADHRMSGMPSETPRMLARRLSRDLSLGDAARQALERIVHAEERARYAASAAVPGHLRADVAILRGAVARTCRLPDRCLALVAPASVLMPLRGFLSSTLDVFSWMDALSASVRNRFGRPGRPRAPRLGSP